MQVMLCVSLCHDKVSLSERRLPFHCGLIRSGKMGGKDEEKKRGGG